MGKNGKRIEELDLPIVCLVPRNERQVGKKYIQRIEASLKTVGLIEPLIVYPNGDNYEILDGCLRYRILLNMGVETVPCLLWKEREAFTGNRMVNRLTPSQEMKMLRKSLEEIDEKSIAEALGMKGIAHRLNPGLLKKLHSSVEKKFEDGKMSLGTVKELAHVKPERQKEILELMESSNDFSVTLARGLVIKTPPSKRAKPNGAKTPWTKSKQQKNNMLQKLQEAEQQQDFYSGLYRQYTVNLLKLVIYVRSLISNEVVRDYLEQHHPNQLEVFQQVINSTEK